MNNLLEFINTRRSIRRFKNIPIHKSDFLKIIKCASMAPSGSNRQNWHFIVVSDEKLRNDMKNAIEHVMHNLLPKVTSIKARQQIVAYARYFTFFNQAPAVICVVEKPYDSLISRLLDKYGPHHSQKHSTSSVQGIAAAIQNILLAAHALGYGTCWMTGPLIAKEQLEKILKIHHPDSLVALIPIGIPAARPVTVPHRKPLDEIVTFYP